VNHAEITLIGPLSPHGSLSPKYKSVWITPNQYFKTYEDQVKQTMGPDILDIHIQVNIKMPYLELNSTIDV
jgi:hypothetical protein